MLKTIKREPMLRTSCIRTVEERSMGMRDDIVRRTMKEEGRKVSWGTFRSGQGIDMMNIESCTVTDKLTDGTHADRQNKFSRDGRWERHIINHRMSKLIKGSKWGITDKTFKNSGSTTVLR